MQNLLICLELSLSQNSNKPLVRYGIDKYTLEEQGLSKELIHRLYKGLYVYSLGFNSIIKQVILHSKNNYKIAVTIWKAF
jgi:hypothetical protein